MSNLATLKPFQKGHDPRRNTKGRIISAKSLGFRDLLIKYGNEKIKLQDGREVTKYEFLAGLLVDKAVSGNVRALKILFDRVEGKAPKGAKARNTVIARGEPDSEEWDRLMSLFNNK